MVFIGNHKVLTWTVTLELKQMPPPKVDNVVSGGFGWAETCSNVSLPRGKTHISNLKVFVSHFAHSTKTNYSDHSVEAQGWSSLDSCSKAAGAGQVGPLQVGCTCSLYQSSSRRHHIMHARQLTLHIVACTTLLLFIRLCYTLLRCHDMVWQACRDIMTA